MADSYQVVSQRQTQTIDPSGNVVGVMEVTFMTQPSGVTASVDVPLAQYNAETVRAMIDARVDQIEQVHQL